jgi:DNA-binding transcriptional regulator YhcF (GntR family)
MSSLRIAEELRARIVSGELKPGARVPSARQIVRKWGVAIATASKALAILADEGLVRAVPGVGTIVDQGLSQERVIATGLAIADREGIAAVTMRRIASELGASAMSLYRHVPSKDELVMLLADAAFMDGAKTKPAARTGELRTQLEAAARSQWSVYRKHPWLAGVISISRPQLLPNGMLHTERTLSALDGRGLSDETIMIAALTVVGYVRGMAVSLAMEREAEDETGVSVDAYLSNQEAAFRDIAATGQYPTLVRVAGANMDLSVERLFEFGLARMLDGLSTLLQRAAK